MRNRQIRIICAANRCKGVLLLGPRHWDKTMCDQHEALDARIGAQFHSSNIIEQGFIDNNGVFLTRKEAWIVAEAAGQIIQRVGGDDKDGGTLYSENLY